ncbi:hypothetical protein [Albimonas pacifica]|uniref:Uncharacterized protein n=1 Tax=Albimonas pacifica TaxID=1114924 RepID=A0A1I3GPT1_9RHOB|nr:hypothetical protein [Albimonas pacifica]SFI25480.1 hypothetical protein SAMN05216258_105280 [Albimonas pacifica]
MFALARLLSVCLTLLALWCAGGGPSFASAGRSLEADRARVEATVHAGHGAHAAHGAPAPVAPDEAPAPHAAHADCAMTASHCAAIEPPAPAAFVAAQTGRSAPPCQPPAEVHARSLAADPPTRRLREPDPSRRRPAPGRPAVRSFVIDRSFSQ